MKNHRIQTAITVLNTCLLSATTRAGSLDIQWEKHYDGPGHGSDSGYFLALDSAGNVIVAGTSAGAGSELDFYIVKYAAEDGALLWEQRYDGLSNYRDVPTALAVDHAGDVIVTGASPAPRSGGGRQYDYYTAKYAGADGAFVWERRYDGPAGNTDLAWAAALDSAGNVVVTGESRSFTGADAYTAKYAAATGDLLWEQRYNGPGDGADAAYAVAVDRADNVIITGMSADEGGFTDFCTMKYAAADGTLLWKTHYDGPNHSANTGTAVATDMAGNAFVTGWSTDWSDPGGESDVYYTAKYAAADGALLWEKRHHGPITIDEDYAVIAVDSAGNLIFSGPSPGEGTGRDYVTTKYAAADGTLLWEKRYNGPGNGDDEVRSVALDAAGNVIVTGSSPGTRGNDNIYTAKYAAADGAVLWERRYEGTTAASDAVGTATAVDSAGSIMVTGRSTNPAGNDDFYTVKYAPVRLDLDDDGLLDSWEVAHFGNTAAHSGLNDTDGDGAVELLEMAFGTDPLAPNSVPTPAVVIEGGYLTTTITKQPCVRYRVETSAALESGFSGASTTVLTDTATTLKVRDNFLIGVQPKRFLRVQVTGTP